MSVRRWQGDAKAVAQVTTAQVTAYDASTSYTLTINGKVISVAGTTDANGTATALAAAWNASAEPEVSEVTASAATDTVTLTGDTAGKPFTVTSGASGGTGTIGAASTGTAATGPNHWDDAANWSGAAVPVNSDDVIVENGSDILYGLDQSAVTLTSLTVRKSYTGKIGLPDIANADQSAANRYAEYRETYLKVGATTVTIGDGGGQGSGRIRINQGTVQNTTNVYGTGSALETGVPSLLLTGSHASSVLNVLKGSVGVAVFASETAQYATLRVGYVENQPSDAQVYCGSGVTHAAVVQTGGVLTLNSGTTSLDVAEGATCHVLAGAHTAVTTRGTVYYRSTGTATALTVGNKGTADFSRDPRGRTVTTPTLYAGAKWLDPNGTVTATNGIDCLDCDLSDVVIRVGRNKNIAVTAA